MIVALVKEGENMIPVHERIRLYLEKHDILQKQLAAEAKFDRSKTSHILTGQRRLKVDDYQIICKALNVDPTFFFSDEWKADF